jgi:glucose-1-phosphate cytidylyltransferase
MKPTASGERTKQVANVLTDSPLVILCGGHGTRLREETEWKPKPMVAVGDWPLLWHIMRYYSFFGVKRFVLCLGYKGQIIRDFFLTYHERWADLKVQLGENSVTYPEGSYAGDDWEIVLANTGLETKTGGRLKSVSKYIDTDRFFLTYGDGLSDVDLNALVKCHLDNKLIGTVTAVQPTSRFAELEIPSGTKVKSFSEKPLISSNWISGGFFVFNRQMLDRLPDHDVSLEESPLHQLAADGQLAAYRHKGFWQCVDTYRELMYVEKLWNNNEAPWRIW